MAAIFQNPGAALTLVIIQNVLRVQVGSSAKLVLEVEPGENFHLVRDTRAPNTLPMYVRRALVAVQSGVGASCGERFAGKLHGPLIRSILKSSTL